MIVRYFFLIVIFFFAGSQARAQCDINDLIIPTQVCLQSNIQIENNNSTANSFEWDLCPMDLQATPTISLVSNTGMSSTLDFTLAQDDEKFYGFSLDAATNSLLRLNFDNSLENIPAKMNLGNVNNLLQSPTSVSIVEENGAWLGLVANAGNSNIILINFGSSLSNTPSATVLHTRTTGNFANISVSSNPVSGSTLIIAEYGAGQVSMLHYPQGFLNPSDQLETISIPGSSPIDVQLFRQCGNWKALVLSFDNKSLYQLDFGTSLRETPVVMNYGLTFAFEPYRLSVVREGDMIYAFVSSTSGGLSRLHFQNDLDITPSVRSLGSFGVLSNSRSLYIGAVKGEWCGWMINYSDGNLYRLSFRSDCEVSPAYVAGRTPGNFKFTQQGNRKIAVTAYDSDGILLTTSHQISVTSDVAPEFNIRQTHACVNHEVYFETVDVQGVIDTYQWTFGDGNGSILQTPTHVYAVGGAYPLSLEVSGENGCTNRKQMAVSIFEKPESQFTLPAALPLCTNQLLKFENTSNFTAASDPSWRWFVNAVEVSDQQDLKYVMTSPGPYQIKLIAAIPGCESESEEILNNLVEGPAVDFDFSGICFGDITSFTNKSIGLIDAYKWEFDDGNESSSENPSHNYSAFGNFSVRLTATDEAGCNNTKTRQIRIYSKPIIDFGIYSPPLSCSGSPTQLYNTTTNADGVDLTTWLWDFEDASNSSNVSEAEPLHIFKDPGYYSVSLTAKTEWGCESTGQKEISISPSPSSDFTFTPACDDKPVTFTGPSSDNIVNWYWEIGTAYYETRSPTHTFRTPNLYPVFIEVTGSNGCVSTATKTILVPEPLSPDFAFTKNCIENATIFTDLTSGADPVTSRSWDFQGGATSTASPASFTFDEMGRKTVRLKVTTESGCSYQVSKEVNIIQPPQASFSSGVFSGAKPFEVLFTNTSSHASQFTWRFLDGTGSTSSEFSPTYTFSGVGEFEVELTAANSQQCQDTHRAAILTNAPLPDVDLEMITFTENNEGSFKMIVTVNNKGNTTLKNLPVDIDFSGQLKLREIVAESILPGSRYNLIFNTLMTNLESQRYVCVSAVLEKDISVEGNRICKELGGKLFVFPAYPNPVNALLDVNLISESKKTIRIAISDAMGKKVFEAELMTESGLNHKTLDVRTIPDGIYHLIIEDGVTKNIQRILISSNP